MIWVVMRNRSDKQQKKYEDVLRVDKVYTGDLKFWRKIFFNTLVFAFFVSAIVYLVKFVIDKF